MKEDMIFLTLFILMYGASAIYSDQLGRSDWYIDNVGTPTISTLHSKKPRLTLATAQNILSTLNLRNGEIIWRKQFSKEDIIQDIISSENYGIIISISNNGKYFRCWDQVEGALKWEFNLRNPSENWILIDTNNIGSFLAILDERSFNIVNVLDGALHYTYSINKKDSEEVKFYHSNIDDSVILSFIDKKEMMIRHIIINIDDDVEIHEIEGFQLQEDILDIYISNSQLYIRHDKKICIKPIMKEETDLKCISTALSKYDEYERFGNLLLIKNDQHNEINGYVINEQFQQIPSKQIKGDVISEIIKTKEGPIFATFTSEISQNKSVLHIYDGEDGKEIHVEDFEGFVNKEENEECKEIEKVFLGYYLRKDNTHGYRVLIVHCSGDINLLQQGKVVWERKESLSNIISSLFMDPPSSSMHKQSFNLYNTIKSQLLALQVELKLIEPNELNNIKASLSQRNEHSRDANGLRKYIISLTSNNRVIAIHNGDGHIIWTQRLIPPKNCKKFEKILLWTYSHDKNRAHEVIIVGCGSYALLNAHNGIIINSGSLNVKSGTIPIKTNNIIPLSFIYKNDKIDQKLFLLLDKTDLNNQKASLFPYIGKDETEYIKKIENQFYYWDMDKEKGLLRGYNFKYKNNCFELSKIWQLVLHGQILSISSRDSSDVVNSQIKILGDRSFKFKYLNKNSVFVAVQSNTMLDPAEIKGIDENILVYVIDTITGRILFSQTHRGAKQPFHSIFTQNWITYHYFSTINKRYEMSILELYDASKHDMTVQDLISTNVNETISSYNHPSVDILKQSYFITSPIKTMAVTKSLKGINNQLLLLATNSDQIYAMNHRFLDARRPLQPTPSTKQERLIPYNPKLVLYPTQYASYNYQILNVKEIVSEPSGLESSSHVFVRGLDLFYNCLQPEKTFDSLDEEDFNFVFLMFTIVGMFIALLVLNHMVKNAKLAQIWK